MSRWSRPDVAELRERFDRELQRAIEGGGVRTDTGLDLQTASALAAVNSAAPDVPQVLIEAARAAFAGQLNGSHAASELPPFMR